MRHIRLIGLASLLALPVFALSAELTVTAKELERLPILEDIPGDLPTSGLRYWQAPFKSIGVNGAYVTTIIRDGQYELWRGSLTFRGTNTQGRLAPNYTKATPEEKVGMVNRGPDLLNLGPGEPRFDSSQINDVFSPNQPDVLSPERGFTRTAMSWFPDIGYVFYCCVTRGYSPGQVPLLPAFYVSKTGEHGTWKYLGTMNGEPAQEAAERVIWCDGGSIHRLDDGRWRAYLNGFGQVAAAVESKGLEKDWRFLKDKEGNIRELLPGFPRTPGSGGCWIHVLQTGKTEWHMWLTDRWPPQSIWHFSSTDGLQWKPYGRQPEITRLAVGGHGFKCMRTHVEGNEIVGLLSVWGSIAGRPDSWVLHTSRMPLGLQPKD
jgi:hypothetical protein